MSWGGGGGGGGGGNLEKKGMFLRILFGDTDRISLFSQFPYNNVTFEQYLLKFSLQKMHLLKEMFLEITLGRFFFDFSIFRSTLKPKNHFSLRKIG